MLRKNQPWLDFISFLLNNIYFTLAKIYFLEYYLFMLLLSCVEIRFLHIIVTIHISNQLYLINTITGSNNFDRLSAFTQLLLYMYLWISAGIGLHQEAGIGLHQGAGYRITSRSWV